MSSRPVRQLPPNPIPASQSGNLIIIIASVICFVAFVVGVGLGIGMGSADFDQQLLKLNTELSESKNQLIDRASQLSRLESDISKVNSESLKLKDALKEKEASISSHQAKMDSLKELGNAVGGNSALLKVISDIKDSDVVPGNIFKGLQFDPAFVLKVKEFREAKKKFVDDYLNGKVASEIFTNMYKMAIDKSLFSVEDDLETANPVKFSRDYNGFNIFKTIPKDYFKKPYDGKTPDTKLEKKKLIMSLLIGEASKDYFIIDRNGRIYFNLIRFIAEFGDDIVAFNEDNYAMDDKLQPEIVRLKKIVLAVKQLKKDFGE